MSDNTAAVAKAPESNPSPTAQDRVRQILALLARNSTIVVFVVMLIISAMLSENFLTTRNIFNMLRQYAGLGIVCMGMLMVILTGGIDLSVGSMAALGSVLVALYLQDNGLAIAVLLTLLVGWLVGSASGILVARWKMAPFVATLALMTIARGLAFISSKGATIQTDLPALDEFARGYTLGLPTPAFLMFVIFIITLLVLRYTAFGRVITAIGSNESAVRMAGIRVGYYKYAVYAITGIMAAIAGIIGTARTGVGSPIVGAGMELDAIAAVVIGGASLSGGRGSALNTLLGVFILAMIGNIMNLMNIPDYPQQVIKGVIIVIAVLLQGLQARSDR